MPDMNALTEGLPPVWIAAALLGLLLVICIVSVRRTGSSGAVAVLIGVPALVVIAWAVWSFADQATLRQRAQEREALAARGLQLTAAAMMPGSALTCIDAGAGPTVEGACETTVFARPEAVATATAYVEARLRLLADSLDYSRRADPTYAGTLSQMRRALEMDRYGFVAHVLETRDGCTAESCAAFALLRDATAVKTNMVARTLESAIARHAVNWPEHPNVLPLAAAPAALPHPDISRATISSLPVTKPIDFPTSASIPPVSIMAEPPALPASAQKPTAQPVRPQ